MDVTSETPEPSLCIARLKNGRRCIYKAHEGYRTCGRPGHREQEHEGDFAGNDPHEQRDRKDDTGRRELNITGDDNDPLEGHERSGTAAGAKTPQADISSQDAKSLLIDRPGSTDDPEIKHDQCRSTSYNLTVITQRLLFEPRHGSKTRSGRELASGLTGL